MQKSLTLLLIVTTGFEAFRFGAGTFRALLDLPARHRIGAVAFAAFSRATDLSPAGIVIYVIYGFGGAVFTGACWLIAGKVKAPVVVRRLMAVATTCSIAILVLTAHAAPLMFRVGASSDDPQVLTCLLDQFTVWTNLRIALADMSFLAVLSALGYAALRRPEAPGGMS